MTITPPRTPRRDSTENRAALILAAKTVLNQDPDATLETIAAEAGLSRRAIYGHFASRDDLLRELVSLGSRRVAAALETVTHNDPVVRLALIASRLWFEVENIRVMTVVTVRSSLKHHADEALKPLRSGVLEAIHAGRSLGTIRDDIAAERLARLMEDSIFAALEESTEHPLSEKDGHHLVILTTLATIGLGWREAETFIDSHDELAWKAAL